MVQTVSWPSGAVAALASALWAADCIGGPNAARLPAEDLAALAADLVMRTLRPGQVVFSPTDVPAGVWIVRCGMVELAVGVGRRRLVVQVLRDGDVFGDIPLLTGGPSPYRPRAAIPTTCLLLPGAAFRAALLRRPAIARLWLSGLAARFADSQSRLLAVLEGPLPQRVAGLLLREARAGVVDLPQATLAAMIGAPRTSLNRVLRRFADQEVVALRYRQVQILDFVGLAALARGQRSVRGMNGEARRVSAP